MVVAERHDAGVMLSEEIGNRLRADVAHPQVDDLGRRAVEHAHPAEVFVFGQDRESAVAGNGPDGGVRASAHAEGFDVHAPGEQITDGDHETRAEVLVDQEAHG